MEIISIDSHVADPHRLSKGMGIALTRDNSGLEELTNEGVLVEGLCLVMIETGKANMRINETTVEMQASEMLFLNYRQSISDIMISANIQFRAFFLNMEYTQSLITSLNLNWNMRSDMMRTPFLKVSLAEEELQTLCIYYDLLDKKRLQTRHQEEGINALCSAFGYEILDIMERHNLISYNGPSSASEYSAIQQHFNRFMELLIDGAHIERKVNWYATQLCITPKYLNTVCQTVSQQSPSSIIERELTERAVKLLKENKLSIKQISSQMGFNNQSHFGSFLRRTTGKSPQQLREQYSSSIN